MGGSTPFDPADIPDELQCESGCVYKADVAARETVVRFVEIDGERFVCVADLRPAAEAIVALQATAAEHNMRHAPSPQEAFMALANVQFVIEGMGNMAINLVNKLEKDAGAGWGMTEASAPSEIPAEWMDQPL